MSPLPGWKVIPDGWTEHHVPIVAGTTTAECVILRSPGPPPFPLPVGWVSEEEVWRGNCRLQELNREASTVPGYQPTEEREYLVVLSLDRNRPPIYTGESGDTLRVGGRDFRLKQSMAGSLLWENDYIAVENQTQQNPGG